MNVRKSIVAAALTLAAPLAAVAATPVSAGQVEAMERAGQTSAASPSPAAPAADFSRRVHQLVVNGASYNDAAVLAAEAQRATEADEAGQPTPAEVEQGTGYVPSSYAAAAAPTRG
jgi:hypothetical protein